VEACGDLRQHPPPLKNKEEGCMRSEKDPLDQLSLNRAGQELDWME